MRISNVLLSANRAFKIGWFCCVLVQHTPSNFSPLETFFPTNVEWTRRYATRPNPSLLFSPSAFFMTKILPELSNVDIDPVECSLKLARWRREVISLTRTWRHPFQEPPGRKQLKCLFIWSLRNKPHFLLFYRCYNPCRMLKEHAKRL